MYMCTPLHTLHTHHTHTHTHHTCIQCKKSAHKQCRDLESSWDQLRDAKDGRGKMMSEKDIYRLEKSCRKMEEALIKADREYRDTNLKTEEARLAYESAMYRCCQVNGDWSHSKTELGLGMRLSQRIGLTCLQFVIFLEQ